MQVNGYAGVDFNRDGLDAEGLHRACLRLGQDGARGVLATIITEDVEKMAGRIERLAALRERDDLARRMIAGIHVEGPFLNEQAGYRGAHPADAIRPADGDAMKRLLDAGGGLVRLVTLAPERDRRAAVTRMLTDAGLVVAAGHCDASLDDLNAACDQGLSVFTHVGNGCPMQLDRHDNIIQRALSLRERLWLCFIADGHHIPFVALGNYLRAAGVDRAVVVTDATAGSSMPPGVYTLGRWEIPVGPDGVARSPDGTHLVGSTATMRQCFDNLVNSLGLLPADALRLTVENPRKAIQCLLLNR